MPFVEIKSNLTNIKFGNDQPGYGSSGLPYIKFTPPTQTMSDNSFNQKSVFFSAKYMTIGAIGNQFERGQSQYANFYEAMRTGNDYPIRGGAIDFQIGQQTYTLSSKIDQSRIKSFFEDKQRGTLFIQKQIGLQLTNPKIETGNTLFGLGQGFPVPGLLENTRVYNNGLNTLAQVGVAGTGAHAVRHGLIPFNAAQKNYYAIVDAQNVNNEKITNRLLNLTALKMTSNSSPFVNPQNVLDINTVNTLGISLNRNLLFQYLGGPGSTYGIGGTTIKRTVNTTTLRSSMAMTYDQLRSQTVNDTVKESSKSDTYDIQDFRKYLGQPSWTKRDTVDFRFFINKQDKINRLYPFIFDNSVAPWEINKKATDDLIKFVFEAVNNDNTNLSTAIFFRAFLTAGITDNNSAALNSFKYLGRGENFYTYQGFDRSIGFSFRLAAQSQAEMRPMYNRLNTLMSQVYPDYSAAGIMRAPVIRITIGDYIYRMPGFLESINVTVDNGTPWEINLQNNTTGVIGQLPQVLDVAVSFKPILKQLPRRSSFFATQVESKIPVLGQATAQDTYEISTLDETPQIIANNDKIIDKGYLEGRSTFTRFRNPSEIAIEKQAIADVETNSIPNIDNNENTGGTSNPDLEQYVRNESIATTSVLYNFKNESPNPEYRLKRPSIP